MKVAEFNLLKKLMAMTTSDVDAEALMAIRRANDILKRNATDWDKVFSRLVTLDVEAASEVRGQPAGNARTAAGRARYLGDLLDDAEGSASGTFVDFVASVREQFERTGDLSSAQVEALERSRQRRDREQAGGRRWR